MAIHDREYATPPRSLRELRYRIQYLAELGIGRLLRRDAQTEDESVAEAFRRAGD